MENQELLTKLKSYLKDRLSNVVVGEKRLSLSLGMCYTASMIASGILKKLGFECHVQEHIRGRARKIEETGLDIFDIERPGRPWEGSRLNTCSHGQRLGRAPSR